MMEETICAPKPIPSALEGFSKPLRLGELSLRSRWAMAPMACEVHGDFRRNVAYYRARAENHVGLIITGGIVVDHPLSGYNEHPDYPRFVEAQSGRLRAITEAVHGAGGAVSAQVWHLGTQVPGGLGAAARSKDGKPFAREAEPERLPELIEAYAAGARMAKDAGFDAVELHGAHGYLLDGYLRRWGTWSGAGSPASRFAVDVIRAVRAAVGPRFPIGLRFSQWNVDDYGARYLHSTGEMERFLAPLVEAGIDLFHASTRRFWLPAFEGSPLTFAGWTRRISGKPVIAVGGFGSRHEGGPDVEETYRLADRLLADGECDLMAVGRGLLHDHGYCEKARAGRLDEMKIP